MPPDPCGFGIEEHPKNPSTADVIDAFARAYDDRTNPRYLPLHLKGGEMVQICVTGLGYESGSPGKFLVSGSVKREGGCPVGFKGFYDAVNGRGNIDFD
jgi:hypothetical protein